MVFIYLFVQPLGLPKDTNRHSTLKFPALTPLQLQPLVQEKVPYPSYVLMLGSERGLLRISRFHCVMCSLLSTCQTHRPHSLCSSAESSCWDEVSEKEPCEECSGKGRYIALKDASDLTFFPPKQLHFKHCCFVGFTNAVHKHRIT